MNETIRIFRNSLRKFERALKFHDCSQCPFGITFSQCHTLMELKKNDPKTLQELANDLKLDQSTISRIVDQLVNKKLVCRKIPSTDRRTVQLSLTEKGEIISDKVNFVNDEYFEKALKSIPPERLKDFLELFEILSNGMSLLTYPILQTKSKNIEAKETNNISK